MFGVEIDWKFFQRQFGGYWCGKTHIRPYIRISDIKNPKSIFDIFFKKWHFLVKKRHFLRRILGAKTKHNYDFFYIFESKGDIFKYLNTHFTCKNQAKYTIFYIFWLKKDIFEWSSQHFRRKNAKKTRFSTFLT